MTDELGQWLAFFTGLATLVTAIVISIVGHWQGVAIPVAYFGGATAARIKLPYGNIE